MLLPTPGSGRSGGCRSEDQPHQVIKSFKLLLLLIQLMVITMLYRLFMFYKLLLGKVINILVKIKEFYHFRGSRLGFGYNLNHHPLNSLNMMIT